MKVRIQTVAASPAQEAYQAFFKAKLEAYGVKSPAELSEEDKSKFFSEIKEEWAEEKSKAVAASPAQEAYQKFFKAKLEAYGVKSPAELSEEDKSKFFTEIKEEWAEEKNKATASGKQLNIAQALRELKSSKGESVIGLLKEVESLLEGNEIPQALKAKAKRDGVSASEVNKLLKAYDNAVNFLEEVVTEVDEWEL